MSGFSPGWLALREPADAQARALDLLERVRADLAGVERIVISDLGCGTGSMGRWLSARLPGPQHWILYDHDDGLLAHAAATVAGVTGDGRAVTVETRRHDVTRLAAGDLTGSTLITASALLDLLTLEEVNDLAAACAGAGCPALLTLSVVGRVEFGPAEPFDAEVAAAFNAHQRRSTEGRRLLGPDAVDAAAEAFTRLGATVRISPSPWRLGPDTRLDHQPGTPSATAEQSPPSRADTDKNGTSRANGRQYDSEGGDLIAAWLVGWVGAACEQRPEIAAEGAAYLRRRLAATVAGELRVTVHHSDLYAKFK